MQEKVVGSGIVVPRDCNVNSHHLEQDVLDCPWTSCSSSYFPGAPGSGPFHHSSCYSSGACSQEEFRRVGLHPYPYKKVQSGCEGFEQVHRTCPGPLLPSLPLPQLLPCFTTGQGECRSLQIWPLRLSFYFR